MQYLALLPLLMTFVCAQNGSIAVNYTDTVSRDHENSSTSTSNNHAHCIQYDNPSNYNPMTFDRGLRQEDIVNETAGGALSYSGFRYLKLDYIPRGTLRPQTPDYNIISYDVAVRNRIRKYSIQVYNAR